MNKSYRLIWSAAKAVWVIAAEIVKGSGGPTPFTRTLLAVAAVMALSTTALALPTGPQIVNGNVSMSSQGSTLTITNSPNSIINWQGFSIAASETTRFVQQNSASAVLNRVVGVDPSSIMGTLQSNGRIFLLNPNGIIFGQGSRVDAAGLVASTLHMSDSDFLGGKYIFNASPSSNTVKNQGEITTLSGGHVWLIAPDVENSGIITAPNGTVTLAAGQSVHVVDPNKPEVAVVVSAPADQAVNLGSVVAQGGRIAMYGAIVGHKGTINANSATRGENGRIYFKSTKGTTLAAGSSTTAYGLDGGSITVRTETGDTLVSGDISTTGTEGKGGTVQLLGQRVGLLDTATVDASGTSGGGTVLIGGDYQGKNPDIQNAQATYVGKDTVIKADATANGDGGKVIVWADDVTRVYGSISARGGTEGGNGGFVETSGKNYLDYQGRTDTRAPKGTVGTLLLDPTDISITAATGGASVGSTYDTGTNTTTFADSSNGFPSIINVFTLNSQLNTSNVTVNTASAGTGYGGGILSVDAPVSWNSVNSLTLLADSQLTINSGITNSGTGNINLASLAGITVNSSDISTNGAININAAGSLTLQGANTGSNLAARIYSAGDQIFNIGADLNLLAGNGGNDNRAEIMSQGSQSFTVGGNLLLQAGSGSGSFNNSARIGSPGNQSFTIGGNLTIIGGDGIGSYNNNAGIEHGSFAGGATGDQIFTFTNNATLAMTGGSGDGLLGYYDSNCGIACSGKATNSGVWISNNGGNQTFDFKGGGSIAMTGGSVGNDNGAWMENISSGLQTIYSSLGNSPSITLQGGSSGGVTIAGTATSTNPLKDYNLSNGADISSDSSQTISATTISMTGGTGASTVAGVFMGGLSSTISATSLTMTGGNGVVNTATDLNGNAYNSYVFATPAVIGNETAPSFTLNIGSGGFTANGGSLGTYGGSPVMLGSLTGAPAINVVSAGNITLNGLYDTVRFGALQGTSSTINLVSGTGGMNLGNASIGNTSGNIILSAANGSILQGAGRILASSLTTSAATGITLTGNNNVATVTLNNSTSGDISYSSNRSGQPLTISSVNQGGNISVSEATGSINLLLTKTGTTGTANILASMGAINDGDGTLINVYANTLNMTAYNGIGVGDAIDTQVANLGAVSGGMTGGVNIENYGALSTGTNPISGGGGGVTLIAHSPLTIGAGGVSASGNIILEAAASGTGDDLTINGPVNSSGGTVTLKAGNLITITPPNTVTGAGGVVQLTNLNPATAAPAPVPEPTPATVMTESTVVQEVNIAVIPTEESDPASKPQTESDEEKAKKEAKAKKDAEKQKDSKGEEGQQFCN